MGLVIQIALGIVLAVIILYFLPLILASGVALIAGAIVLIGGWLLISGAINNPESVVFVIIFGSFIGALFVVAKLVNMKMPHLEIGEIFFTEFIVLVWGFGAIGIFSDLPNLAGNYPLSLVVFLLLTGFLSMAAVRWHKKSLKKWQEEKALRESYQQPMSNLSGGPQ
jgi:hypothetical protein